MSLEDELKSWTDPDVAAYVLGNALGLFQGKTFLEVKGTFWTNNHLGNFLQGLLEHLSLLGVLEHDEREQRFRWRGSFNESDGLAEPHYLYSGPPKDADVKMSLGKEGFGLRRTDQGSCTSRRCFQISPLFRSKTVGIFTGTPISGA